MRATCVARGQMPVHRVRPPRPASPRRWPAGSYTIHDSHLGAGLHGLAAREQTGLSVEARASWPTDAERDVPDAP
jgi:hypothetical protein